VIPAEPGPEDLLDLLWLVKLVRSGMAPPVSEKTPEPPAEMSGESPPVLDKLAEPMHLPSPAELAMEPAPAIPVDEDAEQTTVHREAALDLRLPSPPPALVAGREAAIARSADVLAMARALRPLKRRVPVSGSPMLDEAATVRQSAEAGMVLPVLTPATDRWLRLAVLVDDAASMRLWRPGTAELVELLQWQGAFRTVRTWRLACGPKPRLHATREPDRNEGDVGRDPLELCDPSGRQAVVVITDGLGAGWRHPGTHNLLQRLGRLGPTAVVQLLPPHLWHRSGTRPARTRVRGTSRGTLRRYGTGADSFDPAADTVVPILAPNPVWLAGWARLASDPEAPAMSAVILDPESPGPAGADPVPDPAPRSAVARVRAFRATASPAAFRLACHLAASPLSMPLMRFVQRHVLSSSGTSELAEVMLSGLLVADRGDPLHNDADRVVFDFDTGIRAELLCGLPRERLRTVLSVVADSPPAAAALFGGSLDLQAYVDCFGDRGSDVVPARDSTPFGRVAVAVLRALGGQHAPVAEIIERRIAPVLPAVRDRPAAEKPASVAGAEPEPFDEDLSGFARVLRRIAEPWGTLPAAEPRPRVLLRDRERQLADLADWLAGTEPALVVSGRPGSGKSVLLAVVVAATRPGRRAELPVRPETRPFDDSARTAEVLAVDLAGRGTEAALGILGRQLGVAAPATPPALIQRLRARHRPPVIVVDGLDEADDPAAVTDAVLRPLITASRQGGAVCRLLIAAVPGSAPLAALAAGVAPIRVLDVDDPPGSDPPARSGARVADLLRAHPRWGDPHLRKVREQVVRLLDDRIAEARGENGYGWGDLLIADGLATYLADMSLADFTARSGLRGLLRGGYPRIADAALENLPHPWARPVLATLAYTRGTGMPVEVIHECLAVFAQQNEPSREEIVAVLGVAASFVDRIETPPGAEPVWALKHPALAAELRAYPEGRQKARLPEHFQRGNEYQLVQRLLQAAELRLVRSEPLPCYVRRYLPEHAAAAGALAALVADVRLLAALDPDRLLPYLDQLRNPADIAVADRYREVIRAGAGSARQRLDGLLLSTGRSDRGPAWHESAGEMLLPRWRPGWSSARDRPIVPEPALPTVVPMVAVAAGHSGDRVIAVTLRANGTAHVWDAGTGQELRMLRGWQGPARQPCAALGYLSGGPVLLRSAGDGGIVVHDLDTGAPVSRSADHFRARALACATVEGRTLALAGTATGGLVAIDVRTGDRIWSADAHRDSITYLDAAVEGDVAVVASRGVADVVKLWDLRTGGQAGEHRTDGPDAVLAIAPGPSGSVLIASVPRAGGPGQIVRAGRGPERAVALDPVPAAVTACLFSPDSSLLIAGTGAGKVVAWDTRTGRLLATVAGHAGAVLGLSTVAAAGSHWAVTLSRGADLKRWRLSPPPPSAGRPLVAVAGPKPPGSSRILATVDGTTVRTWNVASGSAPNVMSLKFPAISAAAGYLDGAPVIVAAAHDGGLATHRLATGSCVATASATRTLRVACVESGSRLLAVTMTRAGVLRLYDAATLHLVDGAALGVRPVAFTARTVQGSAVVTAVAADGQWRQWRSGATSRGEVPVEGAVTAIAYGGANLLVGDESGLIHRVRPADGSVTGVYSGLSAPVQALSTSGENDERLVAAAAGELYTWDLLTAQPFRRFWLPAPAEMIAGLGSALVVAHGSAISVLRWTDA